MKAIVAPTLARIEFQGRPMEIECQWIEAHDRGQGLVVFLHEGLGSVAMWKGWPEQVCAAAGCRGLVFSRYGYGASTPRPHEEKWPLDFMQAQAREALPALFRTLGLEGERPVLFGHSDGASIALLHAAMYPDRVCGVVAAAPHVFVEDITIDNIERARAAYLNTGLRDRLARYHDDVDSAFWGWNDVWLDPAFRGWNIEHHLPGIRCPVLVIQGRDDEYGTLRQVESIQRHTPQARASILENCGHSPHKDQPAAVIAEVSAMIRSLNETLL
jgi:pimeloyl-ACP methyl ester carboxylesterase